MSKNYNYEIGYEALQSEWKIQCKRTPRGVSLAKKKSGIYLQFKTPNTSRSQYPCNCKFSEDGMYEAVRKSHLVKAKLTNLTSEVEFWKWYKKDIEGDSQLVDDRLTFSEAIKKVEDDFWNSLSKTKRTRSKSNPSDQSSWYRTYGCFFKHLPYESEVTLNDIKQVINRQKKGTRNYKYVVSAMKKLARTIKRNDILEALEDINVVQTEFMELQSINLEKFIEWRNEVLKTVSISDKRYNLNGRKAWMWVFSTQIVYALRINEVFAIKNLFEPYVTNDGVSIPALNDVTNEDNLIYIGEKTNLGTTVKTGKRIARPQIPPKYPDLISKLDIKQPLLPTNKPKSKNPKKIADFHCAVARTKLVEWNAPYTQTHADRHLGNVNGMQAGIPLEVRAQSMGHTPAMNDSAYKKRQSTQTTIDLLTNSNSSAIDFVTALTEAKKLVKENSEDKQVISRLLSIIYQKDNKAVDELL